MSWKDLLASSVVYHSRGSVVPEGGGEFTAAMLRALRLYAARDFAAAQKLFAAEARRRPADLWPALLAADSAYFDARFEEARAGFDACVAAHPSSSWAFALRGRCRYLAGDPLMLQDLSRALELEPRAGWILCWQAAAKALLGDKEGALSDYEEAARLQPDYERTHSWRGALLVSLGRFAEGLSSLERAERLAPSEVTRYAAARACMALRRPAEARKWLSKAIVVNRDASWVDCSTDVQHADRAVASTAALTESVLKSYPSWNEGRAWLGQTRLILKDYVGALAALEGTSGPWAALWRAETLRRLGLHRAALAEAPRSLAWGRAIRGHCLTALGRPQAGARELEAALKQSSRCGRGLARLWLHQATGRRSDLEKALALHPHWRRDAAAPCDRRPEPEYDPRHWQESARSALDSGRAREALAFCARGLEEALDPANAALLSLRAETLEALGSPLEAFDAWARLERLHPGRRDARDGSRRLALDLLMLSRAGDMWRGWLVHGVMQNEQGAAKRRADLERLGREHLRRFGWRGAVDGAEAVASLSAVWKKAVARPQAARPDDAGLLVLRALFRLEVRPPFLALGAARADLDEALRLDPGMAWAYALRGLGRFFEQDLAGAGEDLDRLAALRPNWAWSWLLKAVPEWYNAQLPECTEHLRRAVALDPKLAWARLLLGRALADGPGDSAEAMTELDEAARLEPSGVVLGWRGAAHAAAKRPAAARRDFAASLRSWPKYDRSLAWRGMLELSSGRPAPAAADLARAVRLNPCYPTAQYALARALLRLGRRAGALSAMKKAAERDRLYLWEWCWFDVEHPNPACAKAVEDLGALEKGGPLPAWALAWRGQSKLLLKDYAGALEDLEAAGSEPWALLWKAEALRRLGRCRAALALLEKPGNRAWAYLTRGACRLHLGRWREAWLDFDRALRLEKRAGRGLGHAWRGEAAWRLGEKAGAEEDFRVALRYYPNWWWLRRRLGEEVFAPEADAARLLSEARAESAAGDAFAAVVACSRVLEAGLDPWNRDALALRAAAHRACGDPASAEDDLKRLRSLEALHEPA